MSIATVVSLYPREIIEKKSSHMQPSEIRIPACLSKEGHGYPEFGPISVPIFDAMTRFYKFDGEWIDSPVLAYNFARSIVFDYFTSNIEITADPENPIGPGLFAVNGAYDHEEKIKSEGWNDERARAWLKSEYSSALNKAMLSQDAWFQKIVRRADDEYNRTRNSRSVSDIHRIAARRLGLERDWTKDITMSTIQKCPACRTLVDPLALLCPNCRTVIKPEEYKKMMEGKSAGVENQKSLSL